MTTVPITQARAELFDLVERAANGERITLTTHGSPRAMLIPVPASDDPRPLGFTPEEVRDLFEHHQMPADAWAAIRCPGDTIAEDGLD